MTELSDCDAVLVINHQTPVEALVSRIRSGGHHRVLVLATQFLFPRERVELERRLAPATVLLSSVADWFSDAELAACDAATTEELRSRRPRWTLYAERFEQRAVARKNALLLDALRRAGLRAAVKLYSADGLGICGLTWRSVGAAWLPPKPDLHGRLRRSLPGQVLSYFHTIAGRFPRRVLRLIDGDDTYLFPAGLRRLVLAPGFVPEDIAFSEAGPSTSGACFLAVGLHDYSPRFVRSGLPVRIFVDGYLPHNYPRTYLDAYGDVEFVCAEPISARWLRDGGSRLRPVPRFLASGEFAPAVAPRVVRTVVFLLGHSGNWTSLVNRSDNDLLVAAALELAVARPGFRIVLRMHPSLEHPRHEGWGAAARLKEVVAAANVGNVEFSSVSLAEDLSRGDLLVAEYSAALIEGWRCGRIGIALNPTRRRSFMEDFEQLGFAHATGSAEFLATVGEFTDRPEVFAETQSRAAQRYNDLVRAHRSGKRSDAPDDSS